MPRTAFLNLQPKAHRHDLKKTLNVNFHLPQDICSRSNTLSQGSPGSPLTATFLISTTSATLADAAEPLSLATSAASPASAILTNSLSLSTCTAWATSDALPTSATFLQAVAIATRTVASSAASSRITVLPSLPQPLESGANTSGATATKVAC